MGVVNEIIKKYSCDPTQQLKCKVSHSREYHYTIHILLIISSYKRIGVNESKIDLLYYHHGIVKFSHRHGNYLVYFGTKILI